VKRRVYIPIFYEKGVESKALRDVCAGLEEEGVPFSCAEDVSSCAEELGRRAASLSPLEIGVGISVDGTCTVCHEKLPQGSPYLVEKAENGRVLGQNAARLAKGLHLLHIKKG
jgi:cytochrome c5